MTSSVTPTREPVLLGSACLPDRVLVERTNAPGHRLELLVSKATHVMLTSKPTQ